MPNRFNTHAERERGTVVLTIGVIVLIALIVGGIAYWNGGGDSDRSDHSYLRLSAEDRFLLNSPITELTHTLFPNVPTIDDDICGKYESNSCPKGCVRETDTCRGLSEKGLNDEERETLKKIQEKRKKHDAMRDCAVQGVCAGTDPADFMKVTRLSFAGQRIANLPDRPFRRFSNLEVIDLRSNNLRELTPGMFEGLAHLRNLHLGHNNLTALPTGVFDDLVSLRMLDLNGNQLGDIDENAFSSLTQLEVLDLRGNTIDTLPANVFSGLSGKDVYEGRDRSNPNYLFDFTDRTFIPAQK